MKIKLRKEEQWLYPLFKAFRPFKENNREIEFKVCGLGFNCFDISIENATKELITFIKDNIRGNGVTKDFRGNSISIFLNVGKEIQLISVA